MVLKGAGAVMVIGASGYLGFYYSGRTRRRLAQLRSIRQILYMLKGEISYSLSTLPESLRVISGKTDRPFREFLSRVADRTENLEGQTMEEIWKEELQAFCRKTCLNGQDLEEWESLGARLGYLDRTMQLQLIDLFLMQWEEKIRRLEGESRTVCRLYQYMGILGGLLLAVLLL